MPEKLTIDQIPVAALEPDPRNARTHKKQQVRQIGASIQEFGFVNPILIDAADRIIAGHARRDATAQLGLETVPVIRLSHLTEHQRRALAIADNRLPENAGWNEEVLAQELKILSEVEVDFDVTITGFAPTEIDLLIEGLAPTDDPSADEIPDPEEAGTRPGAASFTRGHIYKLLANAIYVGEISHKDERYVGEHAPIIDHKTWAAVQAQLERNATRRRHSTNAKEPSLLAGFLHYGEGRPMTPSHANKAGRRYRYYITRQLKDPSSGTEAVWRLPAPALEEVVLKGIHSFLKI